MRKRIISHEAPSADWLDLEAIASVEVTSEDPAYPVEGALLEGAARGWRAQAPGEQTLRLCFDEPRRLTRISLLFIEEEVERTHEFVLAWSPDNREYREIARQQWNFSPEGSTREAEDYRVDLDAVKALEVRIRPDLTYQRAVASVAKLQVA